MIIDTGKVWLFIKNYKVDRRHDGYNMQEQCKHGVLGEQIVMTWAKNCSTSTIALIDVRQSPNIQKKDVDFYLLIRTGAVMAMEVKTDRYLSLNLFIELKSNVKYNTAGWAWKSEADYVIYMFPITGRTIVIPMKAFRKWLNEQEQTGRIGRFKVREVLNRPKNGEEYWSKGILVPIKVFLQEIPEARDWNLERALVKKNIIGVMKDFQEADEVMSGLVSEMETVDRELFGPDIEKLVQGDNCPIYSCTQNHDDFKRWRNIRAQMAAKKNANIVPVFTPKFS